MSSTPWTQDETTHLLELLDQQCSLNLIAKFLGRSYMAVRYKVMKLNMHKRRYTSQQVEKDTCLTPSSNNNDLNSKMFLSGTVVGALLCGGLVTFASILVKNIALVR